MPKSIVFSPLSFFAPPFEAGFFYSLSKRGRLVFWVFLAYNKSNHENKREKPEGKGEEDMTKADLSSTMLFRGMSREEIETALTCLNAEVKRYRKGETILFAGEPCAKMGLLLKGSVIIENYDIWGNRSILSHVGEGQLFAEIYALLKDEPLLVDVTAQSDCSVLFLNVADLRESAGGESWRVKFTANLLTIIAKKGLVLSSRIFHTAPKTIRGRVMAYLNSVSLQKNAGEFDIPFDRQQLADYLNVERSALSKELGRMQRDGLIITRRNHFKIIKLRE